MKPRPRLKKVLLLQAILWPLLLVGAEVGFRVWLASRGEPYDAAATRTEIQRRAGSLADDLPDPGGNRMPKERVASILHPFIAFGPEYMLEVQAREVKRAKRPDAADDFSILILGGSVAGGFGDGKSRGVAEFERVLRTHPDFAERDLHFLRFGYGAYKQPQQIDFAHYLFALGVVPSAILNLDGFNEVALALRNTVEGVHPIYPIYSKWSHRLNDWGRDVLGLLERAAEIERQRVRASTWAEWTDRLGLHHSSILGRVALDRVLDSVFDHRAASDRYLVALRGHDFGGQSAGPKHSRDVNAGLRTAVHIWSQSSRSLHAICEERGVFYFHALQPTLHDEGAKPMTDEERESGAAHETWLTAARRGYPMLRTAGERLATRGIAFHDASRVFADVEETLYYDACHFNQAGNAILGVALGEAFLRAWDERAAASTD